MNATAPAQQFPPQATPEALALLPGGLTPVDLWLNLHTAQASWGRIEDKTQRDNIIASARLMLESLSAFPVARWLAFNNAIGWIPAAITAASWCQGATLAHSVSVWNALRLMPEPEPGADFAARLLNPALLPELTIMAVGIAADRKYFAGAMLIAARDEAPALDVPEPQKFVREQLPRELSQMLLLRGAVPSAWVPSALAPAAQSAPAPKQPPQEPVKEREPEHYNATIANMLRQRKAARGWSDEEVAAALAAGAGVEVSGFNFLKAFRFAEGGSARSVVADENGRILHVGREGYIYSDTLAETAPAELPPVNGAGEGEAVPEILHVPLMSEFITVWRPIKAQRVNGNVFLIDDRQDFFSDEAWGMNYGPRVECEARRGGEGLMLFFKREAKARW